MLLQQATRAVLQLWKCTYSCLQLLRARHGPRVLEAPDGRWSVHCAGKITDCGACGDPIRRLVAKCFCLGGKEAISKAFAGKNYGVGCKGGVEVVAHSLRDSLTKSKGSKMGLLKIDFKNAFNMVSRNHFMKQAD